MSSGALVYCDCVDGPAASTSSAPTPETTTSLPLPTSARRGSAHWQSLASLYFCEECDAIRCVRCVTEEVACYYCPNCLFEVPTASVRGEKNRCARNCFQCPQCSNTLGVVASDPKPAPDPATPASNVGEPPYFLACSVCLWDSKEIGLTFEKPTGLSTHLQKTEDDESPVLAAFDHLKDHIEPFLKAGAAAATAASTARTVRDARYGSLVGLSSRTRAPQATPRDEMARYEAPHPARQAARREDARIEVMRDLTSLDDIAPLDKRAVKAWDADIRSTSLRPQRVPLQSKRTKRCRTCKHILSKPEAKAASVKYRIKLLAINYLPAIDIFRRPTVAGLGSRLSAAGSVRRPPRAASSAGVSMAESEPMRGGRPYSFELAFTNPLYDPIHVRLALDPTPFAAALSCSSFPINAFAEQWEYDDEEAEDARTGGRKQASGIVERRANRTTVLLEMTPARDAAGPLEVYMLVTYVYANDPAEPDAAGASAPRTAKSSANADPELKSFSYWTLLRLGKVDPRVAAGSTATSAQMTPVPSA